MRLAERVVVISGGAQGIGRAYAERFSAEGAVVEIIDKNATLAEETASAIRHTGGIAHAHALDVTSQEDMRTAASSIAERSGRIDVLINNAALYGGIDFEDMSLQYLETVLRINVIGVLSASRAVFPIMRAQNGGSIINIGSTAAYEFSPKWVLETDYQEIPSFHYHLSKAAVITLSKFMAGALGKYRIRVNCVCPGLTLTSATMNSASPEFRENFAAASAIRRNVYPDDIVGTVLYLASDDSEMVTGQVIMVDGGYIIPR